MKPVYYLILVDFRETGTHIVILGGHDFFLRILTSELLLDFLQECECHFILEINCSHANEQQLSTFKNVKVVSMYQIWLTRRYSYRFCFLSVWHFLGCPNIWSGSSRVPYRNCIALLAHRLLPLRLPSILLTSVLSDHLLIIFYYILFLNFYTV